MRPPTPLLPCIPPSLNLSRPLSILNSRPSSASWTARHRHRHRSFSHSAQSWANPQDHYDNLGVSRSASRNEIKDKFYALSRKYHPDAPSVASDSVETRTARFQTLSQSYSILSDDTSRRQYDSTLGAGPSSSYGTRSRYTSGAAHEVGRSGFGGGAGAAWSWTNAENQARRERANYAWTHPTRARKNSNNDEHYHEYAQQRNPFHPGGDTRTSDQHFQTFAAREARIRGRGPAATSAKAGFNASGSSRFSSGTASFGAKADEENRLINDSSTKRTGQVALVFLMTFVSAVSFIGNNGDPSTIPMNDKRRR